MQIQRNVELSEYTSFGVGGRAEHFVLVRNTEELLTVLRTTDIRPIWLLGFGSNTLISDKGLSGLTIVMQGGAVHVEGSRIITDAGVWWDDVVTTAISHNLWGIELMSGVPGSVGAAVFINITAYGQSIGPRLAWVDVWDTQSQALRRITKNDLHWDYKTSTFQRPENKDLIILKTCIELSDTPTQDIEYQKAIDVAEELHLDTTTLEGRRATILEARKRAGSMWLPVKNSDARTVGSFFRNPTVTSEQADQIMGYDETGKTKAEIARMNTVHGGSSTRVSAAHVMLAAGFRRGQTWKNVKLNEQNLLKIEALPGATAQELFDVAQEIQKTVKEKLDVTLEPEARILGDFS